MVDAEGINDWSSALEDVVWVLGEVLSSLIDSNSECTGKCVRDTHTIDETGVGDDDLQYASTPRHSKWQVM